MPTDYGTASLNAFITTTQSHPTDALDPAQVSLRTPFVVCIVGASRGIGAGVAYSYARAGASGLILASRRISGLETTATRCRELSPLSATTPLGIEIIPCDITSAADVAALADAARARFGRLDTVVVNSGYSGPVVLDVVDTDPTTFANAAMVNYVGTFHCAKYLLPLLRRTEDTERPAGSFIAVSTMGVAIVRGPIANAQYCVSKTAQMQLIEHIHEQHYKSHGIAAYAVHPGGVLSEMAEETAPESFKQYLTDSPDLCGSFCVWLTKEEDRRDWLSGRFISATWDVGELQQKKSEIMESDLLKLKIKT